uniref:Uncharacterized protein n=1 Tax=Candidatus Kentrum sp. FM TaxID=2126340 RepID=A0A450VTW9_9GAMM|nr:MAG: hypothetical protein BECKFM1743C_GA0114222_100419 [Candidatus Kentron sp. FM]VFJ48915.1 MAG: hypothetical protein BECKFM1743A_GA0114220_100649 [Candidatus Kentron sp. FM]VFK08230.1 MAG: hypothetical protein BECKFM1743B_GA0114221_100638 [Candidatus Kentron sp. FM]
MGHNLTFAFTSCNKRKGSDLTNIDPDTGEISALFNPRRDRWPDHFHLRRDGWLVSKTPVGRATIYLLRLNLPERREERKLSDFIGNAPTDFLDQLCPKSNHSPSAASSPSGN